MTIESRSDRRLALHELIRRIVECSDRDALVEFHDYRTIFSYLDNPGCCLPSTWIACAKPLNGRPTAAWLYRRMI